MRRNLGCIFVVACLDVDTVDIHSRIAWEWWGYECTFVEGENQGTNDAKLKKFECTFEHSLSFAVTSLRLSLSDCRLKACCPPVWEKP